MKAKMRELVSPFMGKGSGSGCGYCVAKPGLCRPPLLCPFRCCRRPKPPGSCDPWARCKCRLYFLGSSPVPVAGRVDCGDGVRAVFVFPLQPPEGLPGPAFIVLSNCFEKHCRFYRSQRPRQSRSPASGQISAITRFGSTQLRVATGLTWNEPQLLKRTAFRNETLLFDSYRFRLSDP